MKLREDPEYLWVEFAAVLLVLSRDSQGESNGLSAVFLIFSSVAAAFAFISREAPIELLVWVTAVLIALAFAALFHQCWQLMKAVAVLEARVRRLAEQRGVKLPPGP